MPHFNSLMTERYLGMTTVCCTILCFILSFTVLFATLCFPIRYNVYVWMYVLHMYINRCDPNKWKIIFNVLKLCKSI